MRRTASRLCVLLLLAGCQAPPALDAGVRADLHAATAATLAAMDVPEAERPGARALEREVGLLAIQSPPERQRAIRSGGIGAAEVAARARAVLIDLARRRPELTPPRMLAWLAAHPDALTPSQILLLDALTVQLVREAALKEDR